jgi:hypothetical protein
MDRNREVVMREASWLDLGWTGGRIGRTLSTGLTGMVTALSVLPIGAIAADRSPEHALELSFRYETPPTFHKLGVAAF